MRVCAFFNGGWVGRNFGVGVEDDAFVDGVDDGGGGGGDEDGSFLFELKELVTDVADGLLALLV